LKTISAYAAYIQTQSISRLRGSKGEKNGVNWLVNILIMSIIALNTVAIILHSVRSIRREFDEVFVDFEYFSAVFFTIEYCLRLWVCTENEKYKHPIWGRLRYMTSTGGIIDLLAILPFYVSHFTSDTGLIRILRLFRVFRLFKFSRYVHALRVIEGVIKEKREELVLSLVFLIFLLLIASSVMYYLESPAQPRVFSSIPATLWWGITTITSIGYGDIYPVTILGKVFGGIIAISGIAIIALPTGILASGFAEHINIHKKEREKHRFCPHCGKELP
jgi:voltage-gated potassium channel